MIDGAKIRRLREALNMTMKELGNKVGLDESMISKIELNHKSTLAENLKRIADTLG